MKPIKRYITTGICIAAFSGLSAQLYLSEGFESGSKPEGWIEETVVGSEPWRYRNGGHSPNDNNWLVPAEEEDITRNPSSAYVGTYNAIFFKQGFNNERTKLITPAMNLLGGVNVELSFYLCQIPWTFEGSTGWDILRVYYKTSEEAEWILLHEYLDPVYEWEKQVLYLPDPNETYYVAFEGQTRWGYGTCIDNINIQETGSQALYISDIEFEQPFSDYIPSGTKDVPLIRLNLKVVGNTDSVAINAITFTSLNTSDNDLTPNSLKIYSTESQTFDKNNLVSNSGNYNSGTAVFNNLDHYLPRGLSYLWLVGDIEPDASHGNLLDVMIKANDILSGENTFPETDQSPTGNRIIYETIYSQDFDGTHDWVLTGEFEVAVPNGMGGNPGNPNPSEAFSGSNVLGTDLTGLGVNPYNYEPGLTNSTSYLAITPVHNALYHKNLNIFYRRYLNIEVWDHAAIQISTDNGSSWNTLWQNDSYLSDFQFEQEQIPVSDQFSRTDQLIFRFKLGPTDGVNNYSGWSIDDFFLTGEFISKDVGVSEWLLPQSGSGHSSQDSVKVRINNYGGAEITDPVPVAFSLDSGNSWTVNHMRQNIPVGGSVIYTFASTADFSVPGLYSGIRAKTFLPGDQYLSNDMISEELYIVPTYAPPHAEDFELNDGYWRASGINLWQYGEPGGNTINSAASGSKSWATSLNQTYGNLISLQNQTIFEDDFESDEGWIFSGEFERAVPNNMYLPFFAYSGYYCIGTDLTGQGANPYNYENQIATGSAYSATSPSFDVSNYSNMHVSFARWLEIQQGDSVKLEVSPDEGNHWYVLWKNNEGAISDNDFVFLSYPIHDSLYYTSTLSFKFSLFHSSTAGTVDAGINIDDFSLTGDLVNLTPAYLTSPSFDLSGLIHPVFEAKMWIETESGMDGATLFYSLDDGNTWSPVSNSSGFDAYWNWYTGEYVEALMQDGWSGHTGAWITVKHLLPDEVKNQQNVQFQLKFLSDKSNNSFDGIAIDDVSVFEAPHDLGIEQILSPQSACYLSKNQQFNLRFKNHGIRTMQPGESFTVSYYIDRNGFVQTDVETVILSQPLAPEATMDLLLNAEFDLSSNGTYYTEIHTVDSIPHFYHETANDTVTSMIVVSIPSLDLGPDISTTRPDTVVLKAYSGDPGQTYLWQDGSTESIFNVLTEGTYSVQVENLQGCIARDTISILQLVLDVGVGELISPQSDCELEGELPVTINVNNYGTEIVGINDTIFLFGEINQSLILQDTFVLTQPFNPGEFFEYTFSDAYDFSIPGEYRLKLYTNLENDHENTNDTLQHLLEVYGYPEIDLGPDTTVLGAEYILSPGTGYHAYLWQDGSTSEEFVIREAGHDIYHVRVSDSHGCSSYDTAEVTLNTADLSLDQILSPASSCELSSSITVSARIRNEGNQSILTGQTVTLGYQVNGGAARSEPFTLTGELTAGSTVDLTFPTSENVSTGEWYDFIVFVDYVNDSKPSNDTAYTSVGVYEAPHIDLGEPFQIITATEYTLDAGPGFVSYEWQDGNTGQTFTITEPGIGTYSVTVTDMNGCQAFEEVEIMLAVPDVGILNVHLPSTICKMSETEHLKVDIKNFGNFAIEPGADLKVAYSINGAPAVVENVPLTETFSGGATITYTFSHAEDLSAPGLYEFVVYTEFDADKVPTNDIQFVSVDVLGSPVVDISNGIDTLFISEPMTLSVAEGYASYEWQDGSSGTFFEITEPGYGLYTVHVTADNGCITSDSIFIVYDIPDLEVTAITSPESSCELEDNPQISVQIRNNGYFRIAENDTLRLNYSVNSQSSVFENFILETDLQPNESVILTFSKGFDFSAPSDYQISVSLIYAGDTDYSNNIRSKTVTVWGNPEVILADGFDTVEADLPYTLNAGPGFALYKWQDNSTGNSFEVSEYGLYWVMVTDSRGCSGYDSVNIVKTSTNIAASLLNDDITIYPNPAKEYINILLKMNGRQEVIIEIFSIDHKLVYRRDIDHDNYSEVKIDVGDLLPGPYMLRIITDDIPLTYKMVVQ